MLQDQDRDQDRRISVLGTTTRPTKNAITDEKCDEVAG